MHAIEKHEHISHNLSTSMSSHISSTNASCLAMVIKCSQEKAMPLVPDRAVRGRPGSSYPSSPGPDPEAPGSRPFTNCHAFALHIPFCYLERIQLSRLSGRNCIEPDKLRWVSHTTLSLVRNAYRQFINYDFN